MVFLFHLYISLAYFFLLVHYSFLFNHQENEYRTASTFLPCFIGITYSRYPHVKQIQMTTNSSSITTGHAYRLRPLNTSGSTNSSTLSGSLTNSGTTNTNSNSSSSYYGASTSTTPVAASPTWSYSSPSQLARKYANIAPIWCHITKPRQLKKKFASTFHQA